MKWTNKYLRAGAATLVMAGALGTYAATSTASTHRASKPGTGKPTFVLGDKNFAEEYILGDLYQQALQAEGYTVTLKANLDGTELAYKALTSGQIDGYPEYDDTLLANAFDDSKLYSSAAATASAADSYSAKHGLVFTKTTPFEDADDITVTKSYASKYHLSSIGDLKKLGSKLILSGDGVFATRTPDGLPGLKKYYGVTPTFKPTSIGNFYTLLDNGTADAIAGFTTDPQLKSGKYKVLSDPKGIFGYQNVGLVIKKSVAEKEGPAFISTINKVSALLTSKVIIALDTAVEINQENPASVAKAFLKANGL